MWSATIYIHCSKFCKSVSLPSRFNFTWTGSPSARCTWLWITYARKTWCSRSFSPSLISLPWRKRKQCVHSGVWYHDTTVWAAWGCTCSKIVFYAKCRYSLILGMWTSMFQFLFKIWEQSWNVVEAVVVVVVGGGCPVISGRSIIWSII